MADTGVLLRRNTKANLIGLPPVQGEMVFATDTGEHGWLNQSNILVWKVLNEAVPEIPTIPADIVTAPAGVLPALDGSNLTNLPIPASSSGASISVGHNTSISAQGTPDPDGIVAFSVNGAQFKNTIIELKNVSVTATSYSTTSSYLFDMTIIYNRFGEVFSYAKNSSSANDMMIVDGLTLDLTNVGGVPGESFQISIEEFFAISYDSTIDLDNIVITFTFS